MTNEQLPEGLQMAIRLIKDAEWADEATAKAKHAVNYEHAQRITLQHHACDQAQRIAELEAERDELALKHRSQHDADSAELRRVCAARDAARKERDELRARLAEIEGQEPVDAHVRLRLNQRSDWLRPEPTKDEPTPLERAKYLAGNWPKRYEMRLLYARPVPATPNGWRPIETAPKDGTAVLSLLAGSDVAHPVRWLDSDHKFANGAAGWHIVWDLSPVAQIDGPIYWMPIPAAPEAAR